MVMARIGIYGGTFNPPHAGHIAAANFALMALELDRLLVIPARTPPHKQKNGDITDGAHRLEMLKLAFAGEEKITVSDMELQRDGISYTCRTVEILKAQYPGDELFLLMGTDMFLSFSSWYQPEQILKRATIAVLCRDEEAGSRAVLETRKTLVGQGGSVVLLENPVVEISSSTLRRLLVFGCTEAYIPQSVLHYIYENGLYDTKKDYRNLPMDKLETVVVGLLKSNRVAHVLGCRDTARELALRWGADPVDAARAGLLHDITKALDGPLQLTLCRAYGTMLDDFSRNNPKTLHAFTGSLVAERIFGENEAVVQAIRFHTTGKPAMNTLEKIIYVADYMEPNRKFDGVEKLRELAFSDLDAALQLGLEMTLAMLHQQGREISPESQQALRYLKEGR